MSQTTKPTIILANTKSELREQLKQELRNEVEEIEWTNDPKIFSFLMEKLDPKPPVAVLALEPGDFCADTGMFVKTLSNSCPNTAILVFSSTPEFRIELLDQNAAAYVLPMLDHVEIAATVRAILRKSATKITLVKCLCGVEIDLARKMVTKNGMAIHVSKTEWLLFQALAVEAGTVISGEELIESVWGHNSDQDIDKLRTWISRLRERLEDNRQNPRVVYTVTGRGYVLLREGDEDMIEDFEAYNVRQRQLQSRNFRKGR